MVRSTVRVYIRTRPTAATSDGLTCVAAAGP